MAVFTCKSCGNSYDSKIVKDVHPTSGTIGKFCPFCFTPLDLTALKQKYAGIADSDKIAKKVAEEIAFPESV